MRSIGVVCGLLCLGLAGCTNGSGSNPWGSKEGTKVLTSFPPVYCFALNVAGEDVTVKTLMTTAGPHGHGDPNATQIELARYADVIFFNGLGLDEKIAGKMKKPAANPKWNLVELGALLDKNLLKEGACFHDHGHDHGHDHDHDHGIDPHVWLSLKHVKLMVHEITKELKKVDPSHETNYDKRAAEYIAKLDQLQAECEAILKEIPKEKRVILSFHDSLQYFADNFGFQIADVIQVDPGVEPNQSKMNAIIDKCVKGNVTLIAVEPQYTTRTAAKAIQDALKAKGVAAQFVEIDPLETAPAAELNADWYARKMKQNIENLAKALKP